MRKYPKSTMIQFTQAKYSRRCLVQSVILNSSITVTLKYLPPMYHALTKAYVIYIRHTSFQLYHCHFSAKYLHELYHDGEPTTSDRVTLNHTKSYDFCKTDERGEWFDIFVALTQYLLSGESKVGFLNNRHGRNLIHKVYLFISC